MLKGKEVTGREGNLILRMAWGMGCIPLVVGVGWVIAGERGHVFGAGESLAEVTEGARDEDPKSMLVLNPVYRQAPVALSVVTRNLCSRKD